MVLIMNISSENLSNLGSPYQVLLRILIRTIGIAVMCGTLVGVLALNDVIGVVLPVVTFFGGWIIFNSAYRISTGQGQKQLSIFWGWNHLILFGSCVLAGVWSALLKSGVCYQVVIVKLTWLSRLPLSCAGFDSITERILTLSIVGALGFLVFPVIFLLGYILKRPR